MLVYPSVWKENGVVAPIIEVKVLEESHLEVAAGNEKKALLRHLIDDFELPQKQINVGDDVDARISPIDSKLAECKELTKGGNFPEIAVFVMG